MTLSCKNPALAAPNALRHWILSALMVLAACMTPSAWAAEAGTMTVVTWPEDAQIFVDGKLKSTASPVRIRMPRKSHVIKVMKAGLIPQEFRVSVPAGKNYSTTVVLDNGSGLVGSGNPGVKPIEPAMEIIKPNTFMMGDTSGDGNPDELPVHEVQILKPFAIGKFEVSFAEFDRFADATGYQKPDDHGWGRDRRPVIHVSWIGAKAYAAWLSARTGRKYRLPTEAEWEYASRAGTDTRFWWGDEMNGQRANCTACGQVGNFYPTMRVGSFPPSQFGLYDTAGNVSEWVEDCWHPTYDNAPTDSSAWLGNDCGLRVIRGGSYSSYPGGARSANRFHFWSMSNHLNLGFRLARDLDDAELERVMADVEAEVK